MILGYPEARERSRIQYLLTMRWIRTANIFYTEPIATPTRWVRVRPYVWSGARRFHRAFLPEWNSMIGPILGTLFFNGIFIF